MMRIKGLIILSSHNYFNMNPTKPPFTEKHTFTDYLKILADLKQKLEQQEKESQKPFVREGKKIKGK